MIHNKKINKWDFNQSKTFCSSKDSINKILRNPDLEKIFANHTFEKVLLFRTCRELLQLNNEKTPTFLKKWATN